MFPQYGIGQPERFTGCLGHQDHGNPMSDRHWRALERMYHAAPINGYFRPEMHIGADETIVRMPVRPDFFHAAAALHGAAYFKLLDDATFFAIAAQVEDVFVLTASFTISFAKPVTGGVLTARARATGQEGRRYMAEGAIEDEQGGVVARGNGVFVRSTIPLSSLPAYR
jgi:uncharacterized protein (TIGR00369 family)